MKGPPAPPEPCVGPTEWLHGQPLPQMAQPLMHLSSLAQAPSGPPGVRASIPGPEHKVLWSAGCDPTLPGTDQVWGQVTHTRAGPHPGCLFPFKESAKNLSAPPPQHPALHPLAPRAGPPSSPQAPSQDSAVRAALRWPQGKHQDETISQALCPLRSPRATCAPEPQAPSALPASFLCPQTRSPSSLPAGPALLGPPASSQGPRAAPAGRCHGVTCLTRAPAGPHRARGARGARGAGAPPWPCMGCVCARTPPRPRPGLCLVGGTWALWTSPGSLSRAACPSPQGRVGGAHMPPEKLLSAWLPLPLRTGKGSAGPGSPHGDWGTTGPRVPLRRDGGRDCSWTPARGSRGAVAPPARRSCSPPQPGRAPELCSGRIGLLPCSGDPVCPKCLCIRKAQKEGGDQGPPKFRLLTPGLPRGPCLCTETAALIQRLPQENP